MDEIVFTGAPRVRLRARPRLAKLANSSARQSLPWPANTIRKEESRMLVRVIVDPDACIGSAECVDVCPVGALSIART